MKIRKLYLFAIAQIVALGTTLSAYAAVVPVPSAQLIPRTASSIPWGAADRQRVPIDLSKYGYVEEEYFYSGKANVYNWDTPGAATIRTTGADYTNRIIVRRPANISRFSGNVILEVLNATNGWDVPVMWAQNWPKVFRDGDIFVAMSAKPIVLSYLKASNGTRYAPLSWANPLPESQRTTPIGFITPADINSEDGLGYDILSQTAALLKDTSANGLFKNYRVKNVFATGASQSSMFLATYINAVHPLAKLANDKPVIDGYIMFSGGSPAPINQNSLPHPADDVRFSVTRNCDVPIIRIGTEWDYISGTTSPAMRREDSDAIGDRFRLYEVPGSPHSTFANMTYRPGPEEMIAIGKLPTVVRDDYNTLQIEYITNQALVNLDKWVRTGNNAPPRAPRITNNSSGTVFDKYGNAMGGVRLPYLDVPLGKYSIGNWAPPVNTVWNSQAGQYTPFSTSILNQLYSGSKKVYVNMFAFKTHQMVAAGFINHADAKLMIEQQTAQASLFLR